MEEFGFLLCPTPPFILSGTKIIAIGRTDPPSIHPSIFLQPSVLPSIVVFVFTVLDLASTSEWLLSCSHCWRGAARRFCDFLDRLSWLGGSGAFSTFLILKWSKSVNVYSHTAMLFYSCTNHHSAVYVKKLFLRLWVWAFIAGRVVNRGILDGWALVASLRPPNGDGSGRCNHPTICLPLRCAAGVPRSASTH